MESIASAQYTVIQRKQFFYRHLQHEDWTVYIVIHGSFRCTIRGQEENLRPGDVYVIPPHVPFDRTVTETLLVHFLRFTLNPDVPLPFDLPTGKLRYNRPERLEDTVRMLQGTPKLPPSQQDLYIRHWLSDLFLQYNYERQSALHSPRAPEDETVQAVLDYLNRNYAGPLRITDLAARFNVSPSGLIKKFRRCVGVLPQRYLIELRLKHAKRLLVDTSLSICEIAEKTGFETVYYFSKAFKKETGLAPSEYRKNYLT